ncbi:putative heme-copper protein NnrS [Aliarcobacter cibarius]|uniref:Putative heme-copper protein NnrS n=1 Tax=Aliarcobacter cibarius TaxID=255507 RepID=A0A7L5JNX9_9BACT|nr:NnrS family protein [Aliarcobacter cibarius]QKJ26849.1 putative heme-copper protein NnrS [Aliarcobacter cibarius]
MTSWYKKFSSQPHQPFFTNGVIFFILFMLLLFFSYSNILILNSSLLTYHAYSLIFVVFIQFFLGFLFVVFPKFLMQSEIASKDYMNQFLLYFIGSIGIFLSIIFLPKLVIFFQILILFVQILSFNLLYSIHKKSILKDKNDTKWVLISFASGLVAHLLFLISQFDFSLSTLFSKIAINSGFYLFLFMIIFTISQRMIPFFTRVMAPEYNINKSSRLLDILFLLLILKVCVLSFENPKLNLIVDIPLFIFISKELIKWKLPVSQMPPIVWVLHIGLFWIPIAFLISIFEGVMVFVNPDFFFEKAVIHTLAVGYFVTVLIGFGTRVILGHSGRKIETNNFVVATFIAIQILTFLRIFTSISSNFDLNYLLFIDVTSLLLVIFLIIWSSKYIVILVENEKKVEKSSKWKA